MEPRARLALPQDRAFQVGLRAAIFGPAVTLFGGGAIIEVMRLHRETGMGWGLLHIVAFAPLQIVWAAPVAVLCIVLGARRAAFGLAAGVGFLLLANAAAWAIGLAVGATG